MTAQSELAHTQAYVACRCTEQFFRGLIDRVEAATKFADTEPMPVQLRLSALYGFYDRMVSWLTSVTKLRAPIDVQALAVAARTMFELAVDIAIAHNTPNDRPFEKIFYWERSSLLKQAERIRRHYNGRDLPKDLREWIDFLDTPEATALRGYRNRWWNGKHPSRWTGSNLEEDADRAEGYFSEVKFSDMYTDRHAVYCWDTHGSGFLGMRLNNLESLNMKCARFLWELHWLAVVVGQLVLEELGQYLVVEFDDFRASVNFQVQTAKLFAL